MLDFEPTFVDDANQDKVVGRSTEMEYFLVGLIK